MKGKKTGKKNYNKKNNKSSKREKKAVSKENESVKSDSFSNKSSRNFNIVKKVLYVFYILTVISFISYYLYYSNKVIPHVYYRNINMTGKTVNEVAEEVSNNLPEPANVILLIGDNYNVIVKPEDIGFKFLPIQTTKKIYNIGRSSSFLDNFKTQITLLLGSTSVDTEYIYDKNKALSYLANIEYNAVDFVKEPRFVYENDELKIIDGQDGYTFEIDTKELVDVIANQMTGNEENNEIKVNLRKISPKLTIDDLDTVKPFVQQYIDGGLTLYYDKFVYDLTPVEMLKLISVDKNDQNEVIIEPNEEEIKNKLVEIASKIDRNPRGQHIEIKDNKVVSFSAAEDGLKVKVKENTFDVSKEINRMLKEYQNSDLVYKSSDSNDSNDPNDSSNTDDSSNKIELKVQVTKAPDSDNDYNIKDLIGEGHSKFKGSSKSRVHNIELASSRVSGTLVSPGDTFSFNEAVGEISRKTGYSSAWVISKGRTVLGDGGGVCQVSTTMFRAALDAGLPIVERHAHSYRVSYYEQDSPPGIDATIYRPSVDLKFKNDTPGYILIMADFNGDEKTLSFKIYGMKDGRRVEMTKPKILSKTPPPEPLFIDDPTLPKGTKVQVEHPVWGASVIFYRKVFDKNNTLLYDDTFRSNYRAWRAVYKVGTK